MRVVLFFIDGLGLAPAHNNNPLYTTATPCLDSLLGGGSLTLEAVGTKSEVATLLALDATLGVRGLPQSATGQTTIFTGVNAAKAVGRHVSGFPIQPLREILRTEGILKKIVDLGKKAVFLNGYRPEFSVEINSGNRCFSATTLLNLYAGLPFHSFEDMAAGRSVYSDITNEVLHTMGFDVPYLEPRQAGRILADNAANHDFLLFEYFLTDMVAHKRNREKAAYCISVIDQFLEGILAHLDLAETLLIITSDHGNLEDLTTANHTTNPVPCLLIGAGHKRPSQLATLTDVAPYILDCLES